MKRVMVCRLGRTLLLVFGLLLAAVLPARVEANGLNLSWDACGHAGLSNKAFACNTNAGVEKLVLSGQFSMAGMLPDMYYIADLDVTSGQASLPSWWITNEAGACRSGVLSMHRGSDDAELGECQYTDSASGSYSFTWTTSGGSPTRRRLTITKVPGGSAELFDYFENLETWVGTLLISHAKTVGTGSCTGCATPVCIVFNSLQVFEQLPPFALHAYVSTPLERNFVTWQGGETGMAICPAATPVRRQTWGALKSLYP